MSNRLCKGASAFLLTAAAILLAPMAHAQATRTWVSGVGDDVNPCSRTAPCKTFAGAISKTATGGEINALDPGGYGALTIVKSITINGEGTNASALTNAGNAFVVNAPAGSVVTIRNISIQGLGTATNGISFVGQGELHVENVSITGVSGHGINFAPSSGAAQLFVNNTSIRNAGAGAILVKPAAAATAGASLDNVRMDGNGRGLRAEDGASVVVRNSQATGNDANGFVALATSRAVGMSIENSVSSRNGATGIYAGNLATILVSGTMVTGNLDGLTIAGGVITSYGNNRIMGNINSNNPPTANVGQM